MELTKYLMAKVSAMICCLVILCMCFTACSNDDDPVVTPSNPDNPTEEPIDTARYTIIVYGNAGGTMDDKIERVFEWTQPLIKLGDDVRLIFFYKYGNDVVDDAGNHSFLGSYADPGSILYFEMHDKLDLNRLRDNSGVYKDFELYNHYNLTYTLNDIAKNAPARDYIFVLWGHGGGFDAFYDIPFNLKLPADAFTPSTTRGVLYDDLLDSSAMDMYEFSRAIEDSDIDHFKAIFFHNCMMGNLESLTQIQPYADYILSSAHLLYTMGEPVCALIDALHQGANFEEAATAAFEWMASFMPQRYNGIWNEETQSYISPVNGDLNMLRADGLTEVNKQVRRLTNWLCNNYPLYQEAIDHATDRVYKFVDGHLFYDVADYADKLAEETGDVNVLDISQRLRKAFDDAFVHRLKVISPEREDIDFTLSTVLMDNKLYLGYFPLANYSYGLIYSGTEFHQQTGWGNWLATNPHAPTGNPYGQE